MMLLREIDSRIFFAVHDLQKFHLDFILAWPTYLGSLRFALPALIIFTLLKSRKNPFKRCLAAVFPVLLAHQTIEIMKALFKAPRPFKIFGEDAVHVIFYHPENFSFPSGHASTAFAAAMILSSGLGVPRVPAYGLAVLVCVTRLYVGVHFPSDVIAGALWGTLVSWICLRFLKNTLTAQKPSAS